MVENPTTKGPVCQAYFYEDDVVNRPSHYAPNGRDSFMHMKDQMGAPAFRGFLQGNVIKYVQRYLFKGKPTEDLCKAAFYLFHLALEMAESTEDRIAIHDQLTRTLQHTADDHYHIRDLTPGPCLTSAPSCPQ